MGFPGLNMSRSLGDISAHRTCGVSCIPEVRKHVVSSEDEVLLLCSDGIWDHISPSEAAAVAMSYGPDDAMQAASALSTLAISRWEKSLNGAYVDDIPVVLASLHVQAARVAHPAHHR